MNDITEKPNMHKIRSSHLKSWVKAATDAVKTCPSGYDIKTKHDTKIRFRAVANSMARINALG